MEVPLGQRGNVAWDLVGDPERADRVAVHFVSARAEHRAISFGELHRRSSQGAALLRAQGLGKGDRVVSVIPRIPAFYDALLSCMKVGAVAMPGTNLLTAGDLAYRIRRAGAKAVIVHEAHAAKIEEIAESCPSLEHRFVIGGPRSGWIDWTAELDSASPLARTDAPDFAPSDPMLVYFTSGTTAHPKMVTRDYAYAYAHALTGRHWMDLREGDVHWTITDTGWAKAAWGLLFPQWLCGASAVLFEGSSGFDPYRHLGLLQDLGVTTFCAPPTVYRMFAQIDLGFYDFSRLRRSLSAGEPLNPEAIRVWMAATGHAPADGYGQTESICLVANQPGMELRPGSMGRPLPGLDVRLVDDAGTEVADGEVGHIAVRLPSGAVPTDASVDDWPPGLFRGYEDDPDGQACFDHGHYYTGDTATRDADGYIWFVGRSDDVISSAGYRISPFEVESALQEHPAVMESAVVAKPDPLRGHIVVAFVALTEGTEGSGQLAEDIQDHVKRTTAPFKYPREIYFVDELPKTVSGKIRRVQLRQSLEVTDG